MRHKESQLQIQCVKYFKLKYPNITIFSIPNGGRRNEVEASILKAEGTLAGVADLQILKSNAAFHGLFIEMKTEKGRQTDSQREFEVKCFTEGYQYSVCRSFDDFRNVVDDYLKV